jgi:hypothetical protein
MSNKPTTKPISSELRNNEAVECFDIDGDTVRVYLGVGFWRNGKTEFTCDLDVVERILLNGIEYIGQ